jgi:hypothetical protein
VKFVLQDRKCHCHLMGYQPPNFRTHQAQKEPLVQPPAGLAANMGQEVVQPIVGLPANIGQDLSNGHTVSGCRTDFEQDLPAVDPIVGFPSVNDLVYHFFCLWNLCIFYPPVSGGR